jgi:hypothetical protein
MGNTSYSTANAASTRASTGAFTNTISENFRQRAVHRAMDPVDITIREARDSVEHPNSLAIILGLDVTGSMGSVPQRLCRDGLPKIMGKIIQSATPDPAVLFLGIGDHECDTKPLQVGQFESGDEELDHWLNNTWLEGGGGGNYGESYLLAWYFAAYHTAIDCFENRDRKGVLITIGDEPPLLTLPESAVKQIMPATKQGGSYTAGQLVEAAQRLYEVHHIHLAHHRSGHVPDDWDRLLGPDHVHIAQGEERIPEIIIDIVADHPDSDFKAVTMKKDDIAPDLVEEQVVL